MELFFGSLLGSTFTGLLAWLAWVYRERRRARVAVYDRLTGAILGSSQPRGFSVEYVAQRAGEEISGELPLSWTQYVKGSNGNIASWKEPSRVIRDALESVFPAYDTSIGFLPVWILLAYREVEEQLDKCLERKRSKHTSPMSPARYPLRLVSPSGELVIEKEDELLLEVLTYRLLALLHTQAGAGWWLRVRILVFKTARWLVGSTPLLDERFANRRPALWAHRHPRGHLVYLPTETDERGRIIRRAGWWPAESLSGRYDGQIAPDAKDWFLLPFADDSIAG